MPIRILIVDDHPVVRAGLRAVISAAPDLAVVAEAGTGEQAVARAAEGDLDVVLCDLRLGTGMDGIAVITALRSRGPAPAVLIVSTFDRDGDVARALEAGAAGYLVKDAPPDTIAEAVREVAAGRTFLVPEMSARMVSRMRRPGPKLTDREREVLALLATGAGNREIARALFVAEATVKSHLVRIFSKLGVDSRSRAVHVAQQTGLI